MAVVDRVAPTLEGAPTREGVFEFDVYAVHETDSNGCATMPDPHTFRLVVSSPEAGTDGGLDAGAPPPPKAH